MYPLTKDVWQGPPGNDAVSLHTELIPHVRALEAADPEGFDLARIRACVIRGAVFRGKDLVPWMCTGGRLRRREGPVCPLPSEYFKAHLAFLRWGRAGAAFYDGGGGDDYDESGGVVAVKRSEGGRWLLRVGMRDNMGPEVTTLYAEGCPEVIIAQEAALCPPLRLCRELLERGRESAEGRDALVLSEDVFRDLCKFNMGPDEWGRANEKGAFLHKKGLGTYISVCSSDLSIAFPTQVRLELKEITDNRNGESTRPLLSVLEPLLLAPCRHSTSPLDSNRPDSTCRTTLRLPVMLPIPI
jgi:hypothetical protein